MHQIGQPIPDGTEWVDSAEMDRITTLRRFVATWYADAPTGQVDLGGCDVPLPLREFYRAAAGRTVVFGVQNFARTAHQLSPQPDGWVPFIEENQGAFTLLYRPGAADPPVRCDDGRRKNDEVEPLSGVLLQFVLFEAAIAAAFGACGWLPPDDLHRLVAPLRRVPLGPAGWTGGPTSVHTGPGLVVTADTDAEGDSYVFIGAKHPAALYPLRYLQVPWERFDA